MTEKKLKIAVLFRGPVRPTIPSVLARCDEFMSQFRQVENAEFTTYLATWRTWKDIKAADLVAMDRFDNVLMQTQMSDTQIADFTKVQRLPGGHTIRSVWNQYHQCKVALDWVADSDRYDFIVHSRTDIIMQFGPHLAQWFDPNAYVAPHVTGVFAPHAPHIPADQMFLCDQFGVAPAEMMRAAWNYGTMERLGEMIDRADIQERIVEWLAADAQLPLKAAPWAAWTLDPQRNT